ncbi:MAG: NAD(+)/NADH kinase [Firmicutes bacterium]|nr:NAD(+)/NADH kinase [Bacillota bacterium]
MQGVCIVPNWQKANCLAVVNKIKSFFERCGVKVFVVPEKEPLIFCPSPMLSLKKSIKDVDVILVVGGDGTILRVARETAESAVPILGINLGQKGFLAELEVEHLEESLLKLIEGNYIVKKRMMVKGTVHRNGKDVCSFLALNDITVSKGPFSRIVRLDTYINDDYLESYPGDGIIIASPTGSTGYSLSAGGPIVNPSLEVIIITPICPHLLHHRSVIVDKSDTVSIHVSTDRAEIFLTVDGQEGFKLMDKDVVRVRKANEKTGLVTFPGHNFYKLLQQKL